MKKVGYLTELHTDSDVCEQAISGRALTSDEADALAVQVKQDTKNIDLRFLLLAFLEPFQFKESHAAKVNKERAKHILWLLRRAPTHPAMRWPHTQLLWNDEKYPNYKQLWLRHLERFPDDVALIKNAAESLLLGNGKVSERLLKRGKKLAPLDPDWDHWLATLYLIRSDRTKGEQSIKWRKLARRYRRLCTKLRKLRNRNAIA
jgi:predicted Zn-dependent protease